MTKVAIVILNWNGKKDTLLCLSSVGKLDTKGLDVQVLVVDNGSSDNSVVEIRKQIEKIKNLEIVETGENLGFTGGNNVGVRKATDEGADFVLVLNNDCRVDKRLLKELLASAKKHKKGAMFTPKIYFEKGFEFHKDRYEKADLGKVIWSAGGEIDWANVMGSNIGVNEVDDGQHDIERSVDFATGACVLLRASALKEVGMFDEKYFLYMEDVDLSVRMNRAGWGIRYVPKAIAWHKVSQSSGIGSGLNDYFISRNRMLFGMRYGKIRTRIALGRESVRLLLSGRKWQKVGISDAYQGRYGRGSWQDDK